MEKIRLVNSTEMGKENSKRISSKQLEAKITAFTIILAVIVMNILWWTGTQFLELNNNHNITETARPFSQQAMQHKQPFSRKKAKKKSWHLNSKCQDFFFCILLASTATRLSVHELHVLPLPTLVQYLQFLKDLK